MALKLIEGNPGQRRIPDEPKFRPVAPECPAWLSEVAQLEWGRLAPSLERLGLLTEADLADFAGYCQSYSRWVEAETVIERYGMSYESRHLQMDTDGNTYEKVSIRARPEMGIAQREKTALRAFGALFGLSPSDRGRMSLPKQVDEEGSMID